MFPPPKREQAGLVALPAEARDGLSRVWLEILKEKHPGTSWVLTSNRQELEQEQQLSTTEERVVAAA